jgi:chromosomal replication initiation ATPase DnaA
VLVEVRHECIKFFRGQGFSTPEIGRIMRRDHSTIVHALQKMAKMEAAE